MRDVHIYIVHIIGTLGWNQACWHYILFMQASQRLLFGFLTLQEFCKNFLLILLMLSQYIRPHNMIPPFQLQSFLPTNMADRMLRLQLIISCPIAQMHTKCFLVVLFIGIVVLCLGYTSTLTQFLLLGGSLRNKQREVKLVDFVPHDPKLYFIA